MESEFLLHNAIKERNSQKFEDLIRVKSGSPTNYTHTRSPDDPDEEGYSPIHHVAITPLDDAKTKAYVEGLRRYYSEGRGSSWGQSVKAKLDQQLFGVRDREGNTVLHLACKFKRFSLIKRLLKLGADVTVSNRNEWLPIHFAVNGKYLPEWCPEFRPMLRSLISKNEKEFLKPQYWSVVHVAAVNRCPEALEVLHENRFNFSMPAHVPYDIACVGDGQVGAAARCLQFLSNNNHISERETPFHVAARAARPLLLQTIADLYGNDGTICGRTSQGFTALHLLAMHAKTDRGDVTACAEVLVDKRNHVSTKEWLRFLKMRDCNGKCALEICCDRRNVRLAQLILLTTFAEEEGAHFWVAGSLLSLLYETVPLAMVAVIDASYERQRAAIAVTEKRGQERSGKPRKFDYTVITGLESDRTTHLQLIVGQDRSVQKEVLLHPLVKQYLDDRWTKFARTPAYLAAAAQFAVLLSYVTAISIHVCHYNAKLNGTGSLGNPTAFALSNWICTPTPCYFTSILALALVLGLLLKELLQLLYTGCCGPYFRSKYNWCQLLFISVAIVSLVLSLASTEVDLGLLGVLGILAAWLVGTLQLRNLPLCGMYISILTQVTWKSIKILALFSPTFIAFSLVFPILFREGIFHSVGPGGVPVKLIAMMIGELTFDELVKEAREADAATWRYYATLLVFALFAFVATVVLLNLLVAMAVNVTQEVESNAETEMARRTLEQIYMWETFAPFRKWCGGGAIATRSRTPSGDPKTYPGGAGGAQSHGKAAAAEVKPMAPSNDDEEDAGGLI